MDRFNRATSTESLPRPLTSLIGRERELGDVAALLCRDDVQLVTLTGPGGVGKTRLAIEIAMRMAPSFPEGVWFVDLAPLREGAQVIPAIAQAVGISGRIDSPQALLAGIPQQEPYLLLLDNFEQVVDVARLIAQLLASSPLLTMLITSREPLKVRGEREYPVAPLTISVDATGPVDGEPRHLDAALLFADRAQAVLPSFALTADNAVAVTEICRRLDGLPLAIELAAAQVKLLPPASLLTRLESRLPLLSGSRRDLPERQQTMRNAIAWSYDHLAPPEQALFRRLGVFVGGFTLPAAEEIATAVREPVVEVLRDLASLIDKSLVRVSTAGGGEPRYAMLETIREFALEQLAASDENVPIRDAHAAWCTKVAEVRRLHGDIWMEPEIPGRTIPTLETEYGNVHASLVWLEESGNLGGLARVAGSAYWYWHLYGPRSEGLRWLRRARDAPANSLIDKQSRLWALDALGLLARNTGQLDEAMAAAEECQLLARELDDILAEATAAALIGYIALAQGAYDRAESFSRRSIALREQSAVGWHVAIMQSSLGQIAYGRGDLEVAIGELQEALATQRQAGDPFEIAHISGYLALVHCEQGRFQEAAALLAEALPVWQDLNNQENLSEWLAHLATLSAACGSPRVGASLLASASTLRDAVGHAFSIPERATYERTEQSLRDTLGGVEFAHAWQAGAAMSAQQAVADASAFLETLLATGTAGDERAQVPFGLTSRELDVLRLLVDGQSDKEIADALFIGTRTVETHVGNVLAKLGVRNRAEAAVLATRNGLA
jgi:predicted ATPase/DNA-binding CsgD family transcriptional regulator